MSKELKQNIERSKQIFKYISENLPDYTITKLVNKLGNEISIDAYKAEVSNGESAYMLVFRFENDTISNVEKITTVIPV